jgi:hypothetical protein
MNWQAVTLLRILADLACILVAFVGGGVLFMLGDERRALSLFVVAGLIAWTVRPTAEQVDTYSEFQKHRAQFPRSSTR